MNSIGHMKSRGFVDAILGRMGSGYAWARATAAVSVAVDYAYTAVFGVA